MEEIPNKVAPSEGSPASWFRPGGFALLLAGLVLIDYSDVILGINSFYIRDFHLFGYPLAAWFRSSILTGEIPLWNPLNYCGLPFLAQWNTMVLYPPNWLTLLLPLSWSVSLLCVLHLYAGGLGMYFLAASWTRNFHAAAFAGVAYAFNGLMQNCLMWPNNIAALGCLPWVLLTVSSGWRKGGGWLSAAVLAGGLQMLSGAPEIILLTWLILLALFLVDLRVREVKRRTGRFILMVALIAAVSAAQLIPFFDLLSHSQKTGSGATVEWSISLHSWANFFIPLFENIGRHPTGVFHQASQNWTHSYYAGLTPWLLLVPAAVSGDRRRWIFLGILPVAYLMALGPASPVFSILSRLLPLEAIRYPVKFLTLTAVALPLIGAFGLRRVLSGRATRHLIVGSLLTAGAFVVANQLLSGSDMSPEALGFAKASLRGRLPFMVGSACVLGLIAGRRYLARQWACLILITIVWCDLRESQSMLAPSLPRAEIDRPIPGLKQFESARLGQGRIAATAQALYANLHLANTNVIGANQFTLFENVNLISGLSKLDGFYSLWLPWLTDAQQRLRTSPNSINPGFADFLGVRWLMAVDEQSGRRFEWHPRTDPMPFVTAGQKPFVVDPDFPPAYLGEPGFDPRSTVALSAIPEANARIDYVPEARIQNVRIQAHEIGFEVSTPRPTIAVISQADYHWWRATLNRVPAPILRANHAFQAVMIPAGEHQVTLRYTDQSFRLGVAISLLGLVSLGVWERRRRLRPADVCEPPPTDRSD
jgi:hypothetical protein